MYWAFGNFIKLAYWKPILNITRNFSVDEIGEYYRLKLNHSIVLKLYHPFNFPITLTYFTI